MGKKKLTLDTEVLLAAKHCTDDGAPLPGWEKGYNDEIAMAFGRALMQHGVLHLKKTQEEGTGDWLHNLSLNAVFEVD